MLSSSAPARQQAHALVDRMTPLQISALINLFEPLTQAARATISRAPFCDELPIDADDASSIRALPPIRPGEQPLWHTPADTYPNDSDTWPAAGRSRNGVVRSPAA